MSEVVWRPTPEIVERASVTRLMRRGSVAAYPELLRRSWEDPEWFWPLVVEDLVLEFLDAVGTRAGRVARARVGDVVRRLALLLSAARA